MNAIHAGETMLFDGLTVCSLGCHEAISAFEAAVVLKVVDGVPVEVAHVECWERACTPAPLSHDSRRRASMQDLWLAEHANAGMGDKS